MAAIDETKVIVILRLTSPSNSNVQKFEAMPPGQTPITNNPKPIRGSWIMSIATPNENCSQMKKHIVIHHTISSRVYLSTYQWHESKLGDESND
jgi:hypothetical protein